MSFVDSPWHTDWPVLVGAGIALLMLVGEPHVLDAVLTGAVWWAIISTIRLVFRLGARGRNGGGGPGPDVR